jgi:hypothetical protein
LIKKGFKLKNDYIDKSCQITARYCDRNEEEDEEVYINYYSASKELAKTRKVKPLREEELEIFEKEIKKPRKKRAIKKRITQKQDDNFFNKVKEFLSKEDIEIMDIQTFNRNHLILKIKEDEKEKLVIAYNKKRVTDTDLIKAYNKSLEENLPYIVLSLGDSAKKLRGLILAIKNLSRIEKIE